MYSTNSIKGHFFIDPKAAKSDKMVRGRFSESVKTGRKDAEGKDIYEYQSWPARFIGKAYEKAVNLADKSKITLTQWAAYNPYVKEKGLSYPYLLVMDFEVQEQGQESTGVQEAMEDLEIPDFVLLGDEEDALLPF